MVCTCLHPGVCSSFLLTGWLSAELNRMLKKVIENVIFLFNFTKSRRFCRTLHETCLESLWVCLNSTQKYAMDYFLHKLELMWKLLAGLERRETKACSSQPAFKGLSTKIPALKQTFHAGRWPFSASPLRQSAQWGGLCVILINCFCQGPPVRRHMWRRRRKLLCAGSQTGTEADHVRCGGQTRLVRNKCDLVLSETNCQVKATYHPWS